MSRTPCPAPAVPGATAPLGGQLLATLVDFVDRGLDLRRHHRARLIRVRTAPTEGLEGSQIEVGFRPIDAGAHPLDDLVGFVAPPEWAAIGLAATGIAAPFDGGSPFPVRSVHLVDRSGAWASSWRSLPPPSGDDGDDIGDAAGDDAAVRVAAGSPPPTDGVLSSSASGDDAPTGRVDDALRRALGVATGPPPPGGTLLLWTVIWLDSLVATVAAGASRQRRQRSKPAILGTHPAVTVLGLDPATIDADELVAEGRRLADLRDWSQLRRSCASTAWQTPDLDAATAAWLDDGSFARWLLGTRPDLDDLHEALTSLLVPSTMAVIDEVLAGWNLLPLHGPPVPDPRPEGQ